MNEDYARFSSIKKMLALSIAGIILTSCTPKRYMGISLEEGAAPAAIQALGQRARGGNKEAQLELGVLFEDGIGLEQNLTRAKYLYRRASKDTKHSVWVYMPAAGYKGRGGVVKSRFVVQRRVSEAEYRLRNIDNKFGVGRK